MGAYADFAARVRGADLMRDLSFDGLSLAFLKNLEKITFASSAAAGRQHDLLRRGAPAAGGTLPCACPLRQHAIGEQFLAI